MPNQILINYYRDKRNETWSFETKHYIDDKARQIFEDLINKSITHWRYCDIEKFLETEGNLISKEIILPQNKDDLREIFNLTFKNDDMKKLKQIIFCTYGIIDDTECIEILKTIRKCLPDQDIYVGHIPNLTSEKKDICVHIIAIFDF
jgi:phage pi2 protein 07